MIFGEIEVEGMKPVKILTVRLTPLRWKLGWKWRGKRALLIEGGVHRAADNVWDLGEEEKIGLQ